MMNKLAIISVLSLSMALAGCASSGNNSIANESQASIQTKLVKGQTTKQQVEAYFGGPMSVSFNSDGFEVWSYILANTQIKGTSFIPFYGMFDSGATTKMKHLVILFKDDKVDKYTLSDTTSEVKSGILN